MSKKTQKSTPKTVSAATLSRVRSLLARDRKNAGVHQKQVAKHERAIERANSSFLKKGEPLAKQYLRAARTEMRILGASFKTVGTLIVQGLKLSYDGPTKTEYNRLKKLQERAKAIGLAAGQLTEAKAPSNRKRATKKQQLAQRDFLAIVDGAVAELNRRHIPGVVRYNTDKRSLAISL